MAKLYFKKVSGIIFMAGVLLILMIISAKADVQWGNPTTAIFTTGFEGYICSDDGAIWTTYITGGAIEIFTLNDCSRDSSKSYDTSRILLADGKCCPSNKPICQQNTTGGKYDCIQNTVSPVLSCEDYSTDHCGDANSLAREELTNSNYYSGTEYGCGHMRSVGNCVESVDCICKVKDGSCKPDGRVSIWNGTATVYKEPASALGYIDRLCGQVSIGDCILDITKKDECNTTNTMVLSSTPTWEPKRIGEVPPDWCVANSKRLPCPAQLNFISISGIIVAVVLIIILYYYISRKKVRGKKK